MSSIERWYGQQVENSNSDRQKCGKLYQPIDSPFCRLASHGGNLDRASQLAFVFTALYKAHQKVTGFPDDEGSFTDSVTDRAQWRESLDLIPGFRRDSLDAQTAVFTLLPKASSISRVTGVALRTIWEPFLSTTIDSS